MPLYTLLPSSEFFYKFSAAFLPFALANLLSRVRYDPGFIPRRLSPICCCWRLNLEEKKRNQQRLISDPYLDGYKRHNWRGFKRNQIGAVSSLDWTRKKPSPWRRTCELSFLSSAARFTFYDCQFRGKERLGFPPG